MIQAKQLCMLGAALAAFATACASTPDVEPKAAAFTPTVRKDGTVDDRALCEYKGKADREVSEVAGPGSVQPNVRRVYQLVGVGDERHKVLVCREIDTNFDGVKDVVRRYNEKGESIFEEADSNLDGRIDTWITFSKGHLAEAKFDVNFDGKADEWKYYTGGKLSRMSRDTTHDGKADVWEIYREGKLERMGVDVDGDEHVDRWDHDNDLRRRFEEAERKKDEEAVALAAKKAADAAAAAAKEDEEQASQPGSKRKKK